MTTDSTPQPPLFFTEERPLKVEGNEVYRFLTTQFLHQNQLSWSRLQTQFAVEAGVLAWFFSHAQAISVWIAFVGMVLGSAVVWLLYQLVQRDWEIRDQHLEALTALNKDIGIGQVLIAPQKEWRTGKRIAAYLTYGCCVTNVVLAVLVCHRVL